MHKVARRRISVERMHSVVWRKGEGAEGVADGLGVGTQKRQNKLKTLKT